MTSKEFAEMFGLNEDQFSILCSLEFVLVKHDIAKDGKTNHLKEEWLGKWMDALKNGFANNCQITLNSEDTLKEKIKDVAGHSFSKTWFYLVMLEATLYEPYFPLSDSKEEEKKYSGLKYKADYDYLKALVADTGIIEDKYIDRFKNTYEKAIKKLHGVSTKALIILIASALAAAAAAIFAGPIAVGLFGSAFDLSGAALVSACLAMAGGGAIAAGGLGMAGGVAAIAGGGALLGAACGGAGVAVSDAIAKNSPEFTYSQSAKLEVVLKEIMLNAQKDTASAQLIIDSLKTRIIELKEELQTLKQQEKENKEAINNLDKSLKALQRAYTDMNKFKSSFEIGLNAE